MPVIFGLCSGDGVAHDQVTLELETEVALGLVLDDASYLYLHSFSTIVPAYQLFSHLRNTESKFHIMFCNAGTYLLL